MRNGLYLTLDDSPAFNDDISQHIDAYDRFMSLGLPKLCEGRQRCQNVTFVVTENCNLACTYCYETHKTPHMMSKETVREAIDFIFDKERINGYWDPEATPAVVLEFMGGEPLLNIEVIDYAVEYFRARALDLGHPWGQNYMISISSNGTLYFDPKVQDFIRRNRPRLSLGITVDGNKAQHDRCRLFHDGTGSYDCVRRAVEAENAIVAMPGTKATLSPENVGGLFEAQKALFDLGFAFAFTNCCYEEGWTDENARTLYKEMKRLADWILENKLYTSFCCTLFNETIGDALIDTENWCGGNGKMLAIGPDGKCYSCVRFMKYSLNNQEEQPIGDIYKGLDSPRENVWLCALQKIDMCTQCQHDDCKKCLTCPVASGCSLCTGFNYDTFGDPNHKATFICEMHKARVLGNVYFWNKLYGKLGLAKRFTLNLPDEDALRIVDRPELDALKALERRMD